MEKITAIREELESLMREEDVLAASVNASSGAVIAPKIMKIRNLGIWNMVGSVVGTAFALFTKFGQYHIQKINLELGEYRVVFTQIDSSTLLTIITPQLANQGVLDVEIENTRRACESILHGKAT